MAGIIGLVIAVVVIGGAIWFIRKRKETKADAPTTGGSTGGKAGGGKNVKMK